MKNPIKTILVILTLSIGFSAQAKDRPKYDFNSMIENVATEQESLATEVTAILENSPTNDESQEVADFLNKEVNWEAGKDFVDNRGSDINADQPQRQPNSVGPFKKVSSVDFNI